MPAGVVTVTSTAGPGPAGLVAVIVVSLTTVKLVAAVVPKSTAVAPVKPVPVIVTEGTVGSLPGLKMTNPVRLSRSGLIPNLAILPSNLALGVPCQRRWAAPPWQRHQRKLPESPHYPRS